MQHDAHGLARPDADPRELARRVQFGAAVYGQPAVVGPVPQSATAARDMLRLQLLDAVGLALRAGSVSGNEAVGRELARSAIGHALPADGADRSFALISADNLADDAARLGRRGVVQAADLAELFERVAKLADAAFPRFGFVR